MTSPRAQDGFTIVEVLIAVLILVVGLLSLFTIMDASRSLTLVAERQTSIAHRAENELERIKSIPYAQVGLTGTSSSWSAASTDPTYVSVPSGACPAVSTGPAPTYQPDHSTGGSTATAPLVINGCSYTNGSSSTAYTTGTVAPVAPWSDGRLSGNIYDFVTWASDPTCSATSTPGSICPTSNDYKRVTIVVTLNGVTQPSHPAILSAVIVDPNAVPANAPAGSTNDPVSNPTVSCQNSQGQTVPCSNSLNGTPIQYFPTDCSYSGSCPTGPSCSGNVLHDTITALLGVAAAPDSLSQGLPSGNCTGSSGNPTPPCFGTDVGCGSGAGVPIKPSGSSSCGTPPVDNTKTHSWVAPAIPSGTSLTLTGKGSMTTYLESSTGVAINATLCVGLYIVPGSVIGSLTGNLLAQPIGAAASAQVTAAAGVPTPVSFDFNTGQSATLTSTPLNLVRLEVVVWLAASASTVDLVDDQVQYASQVTVIAQ